MWSSASCYNQVESYVDPLHTLESMTLVSFIAVIISLALMNRNQILEWKVQFYQPTFGDLLYWWCLRSNGSEHAGLALQDQDQIIGPCTVCYSWELSSTIPENPGMSALYDSRITTKDESGVLSLSHFVTWRIWASCPSHFRISRSWVGNIVSMWSTDRVLPKARVTVWYFCFLLSVW